MKTIRNLTLILLAFVAASCSDDEVNYAPLSVTQVTDINHEQVLQSADLAQYIVIQGTGLNAVQSIMFNDIAVDMLEAYVTENEIVLSIPRVIPTNVNNLITLESATETVTVPFEVFVPELQVSGMGNEFALPGTFRVFTLQSVSESQGGRNWFGSGGAGAGHSVRTVKVSRRHSFWNFGGIR